MKNIKFKILAVLSIVIICVIFYNEKDNNMDELQKKHMEFVNNHPFQKTLKLTKEERKDLSIPPNKYFEQEYLLEMNPRTGKPEPEKLYALQEKLNFEAKQKSTPGASVGNAWIERGPRDVPGRTRAVMYDPNDPTNKRVFAGGVAGGLWVTNNIESGLSWELLDVPENLAISCITSDPNDPQIMYVGTGEAYTQGAVNGNGIWKSINGGDTWIHIFGGSTGSISANVVPGHFHINDIIAWDNNGTTEVFAGVTASLYLDAGNGTILGDDIGLFKSTNNGDTWNKIPLFVTGTTPYIPNDFEIGADNTLWMSTTGIVGLTNTGSGRIFSSFDGVNFTLARNLGGRRTEIAVSATDPDVMYALYQTNSSANPIRIVKTTNQFATISNLPLPNDAGTSIPANDFTRGQSFYDLMIAVDPNNDAMIYVGGIDVFRSTNSGQNWDQITKWTTGFGQPSNISLAHADIHELIFHPTNSNSGLIASDGGIHYGVSFSAASNSSTAIIKRDRDYKNGLFYKGAIGQDASQDELLGGTQDNGTNYVANAGSGATFSQEIIGGDGMLCFIDKDGQYLIGSTTNNNYLRYDLPYTGGTNGGYIVLDGNSGSFVNQATLDDNLDILYTDGSTGTARISRYSNFLNTIFNTSSVADRVNLTNFRLNARPTTFKVSPYTTGSTTLLVGLQNGKVLKITNANTSPVWEDISNGTFFGSISAVEFGANENEIMVTLHNYGVTSIWFTENGGSNWQNKEGDFPDIPIKAIMMNPLLNDEVIIGTDLGVWRTGSFKTASPNWVRSQNGMKNVKVTSFDLRTADNTVLASTYGRGLFTGQFTANPVAVGDATFKQNTIQIYPTVSKGNFTIKSTEALNTNMQVFDLNGRRVFQNTLELTNETNISLNLEKGMYIIHFNAENLSESYRIVIK